jgi:hypothetical protein
MYAGAEDCREIELVHHEPNQMMAQAWTDALRLAGQA